MQALLFAGVASAGLVLGAVAGVRWVPPKRALAALLAFASGALTSALAFELFEEAFTQGGHLLSAAGLAVGAGVFIVVDVRLDRRMDAMSGSTAGATLLAAVVLDGIPENIALGTTLAAGSGSVALLAAIFVSNFPEALVGARTMCENGRSPRHAIVTWFAAAAVLAAAVVAGALLLTRLLPAVLSVLLSFAGGAVLASLSITLFPKAYADGGPWVAAATVAGFLVAFTLGTLGAKG